MEGLLREANEGGDREARGAAKEVLGGHREERAREGSKRRRVEGARDAKDQQGEGNPSTRKVHSCCKRPSRDVILAENS